mgnify:CR=1 FL=1
MVAVQKRYCHSLELAYLDYGSVRQNGIKVQTYETRPRNGLAPYADITKREFKMMDRNLGAASGKATKVAEEAIKTYGVYFQFGRKDPFPAAGVMTRTSDADIVPVYDASGNKI